MNPHGMSAEGRLNLDVAVSPPQTYSKAATTSIHAVKRV
ncbi:hypothetical protein J2T13_004708 [Paenibacillus sp. DS2015]